MVQELKLYDNYMFIINTNNTSDRIMKHCFTYHNKTKQSHSNEVHLKTHFNMMKNHIAMIIFPDSHKVLKCTDGLLSYIL